jgi:ABC-type transport system involved in multi-copper enzyme maturation permease subunit
MAKTDLGMMEDVVGVRPRISWGAIFAGAFIAVVALLVMSTIGTAVGLSVTRGRAPQGTATLIWAIAFAMVSLFLGGWTSSQCVARETRREAALQGTVLWGVIYFSLILLGYLGVFTSFNIVMGISGPVDDLQLPPTAIAEIAQALSLSPDQIVLLEELLGDVRTSAELIANAWWTLAGVVASLFAAVLGSIAGTTPKVSLRELLGRRRRIVVAPQA